MGVNANWKAQREICTVSRPGGLLDLRYVQVPCFQGR